MAEIIDTTQEDNDHRCMAIEAIGAIAPSRIEWVHSLKPGDIVASRWRSPNHRYYLLEQLKEVTIYDPSVESRISVQLEDGQKLDSFWVSPISTMENQ